MNAEELTPYELEQIAQRKRAEQAAALAQAEAQERAKYHLIEEEGRERRQANAAWGQLPPMVRAGWLLAQELGGERAAEWNRFVALVIAEAGPKVVSLNDNDMRLIRKYILKGE